MITSKLRSVALLLIIATQAFAYGRFTKSNGVISDSVTGQEWLVGPETFTWYEARIWLSELGGDWHLPTTGQLWYLGDAGVHSENWGLFESSSNFYSVWASDDCEENGKAWTFTFWGSSPQRQSRDKDDRIGVFAVRSSH